MGEAKVTVMILMLIRNHRGYLEAKGEVLSKKLKRKLLSEFNDQINRGVRDMQLP